MLCIEHFIGGESRPSISAERMRVWDPARGRAYATLASGDSRDVDEAVRQARAAVGPLKQLSLAQRAQLLHRVADLLEARSEEFAQAESLDAGKPIRLCRDIEIPRAIANLRFFAAAATQFGSESYADSSAMNLVLRAPLGVVGTISPWNLPLYLLTWKIAPALAAGNAVIAKPSELTPMTASMLAPLFHAAGFPAGAFNVLHGTGARVGEAMVKHRDIKAISFTGGTETGRAIYAAAAPQFKKLSLELGGKNATVVFADTDLAAAMPTLVRSAFQNQGQICLCGSRLFIERSVFKAFREAFVEQVQRMTIGNPQLESTDQGALISAAHRDKVERHLAVAHAEGGRLLCGGDRPALDDDLREGFYLRPSVFDSLPFDCRTNQEEIFGPLATLIPFDDETEVLTMANSTPFGLAASVWTRDFARAQRMSEGLDAGLVWINSWMSRDLRAPFGGVKQSGLGREGGLEAMRFFTESKTISWPR